MTELSVGHRLKKLRERTPLSVREVAARLDKPSSTYSSYEDKFKKPFLPISLVKALIPIFAPYGVAARELLELGGVTSENLATADISPPPAGTPMPEENAGSLRPPLGSGIAAAVKELPRDFPILGCGRCGDDGLFEFQGDIIDYTRRPPRLADVRDAYALYVRGSSMEKWRRDGDFVFVHPHQPIKIGDYVVVQLKPEHPGGPMPAYIKQLVRRNDRELRLLQFNPEKELSLKANTVATVHRIVDWSELFGL